MDTAVAETVYVVLGSHLQEGFKTLEWTIKKWKPNPNPISIVILHITNYNISKDFVYTPFGKLPASSVSEEKLQLLRNYEKEKIDKLLSKYIAFCGKVKVEIVKAEKSDEPIHRVIVELISRYKITRLVMGLTFFKTSSWRSKNAISGSFYIHQHKPNSCEFFIICGGKCVFFKEENEEATMEDDEGQSIPKRGNIKNWLGKISFKRSSPRLFLPSTRGAELLNSENQWEICFPEMQKYYEHLMSLNLDEQICEEEDNVLSSVPPERETSGANLTVAARMETMKSRIDDARKLIRAKNEEAKLNAERTAKAEWAINLCNNRVEELEDKIKEEFFERIEMKKRLDIEKEQIQEMMNDIAENKNRLKSLVELQSELSNKLQISALARSHGETRLKKAVIARAEMVREIEELRRQRDILHRRIEFCKEKDAIGTVSKSNELSCGYREYSEEDIRLATDGFSESLRLKTGGNQTNVYKGRIHNLTVAIKMLRSDDRLSQDDFLAKVKVLSNIRHPHLVAIVGFCSEQKCIILEYMHKRSLRENLFSSKRIHRKRNQALQWHDRIRIAYEVCLGLTYLHSAKPKPIVHRHLTSSNILLDCNLVAKISGLEHSPDYSEQTDLQVDIRDFGALLLHLLTGRICGGLVEESMKMDEGALDETAGKWPLDLAKELVGIALKCINATYCSVQKAMEEVEGVKRKASEIVSTGGSEAVEESGDKEHPSEAPGIFLCPIYKEVMINPYLAADGFSYELEAIEEWLKMGRETSPMTNLRLKNTFLTPNHTLRSLIREWHDKKSAVAT